ncbi:hypothetical protein MMC16_007643 [Acarospora aff. strigata]|nr:hypothetical protein [Acarospora aff. strigata]
MRLGAGLEHSLYDDTGSSDEEDDRETGTSDSESDISIDDIITDLGGGLSLMERYPVLLNDAPPGSSNSQGARSKSGQKQRGAVRGANNGKLLPGEKKRLKREKMNAKRAARSAAHGLDLESINAELVQFVAADDDMKVHPATLHAAVETDMVSQLQLHTLLSPGNLLYWS